MSDPTPTSAPSRSKPWSRSFAIFLLLVGLLYGLTRWIVNDPTAREVVGGGLANVFGFLTTPFILEGAVAFIGLVVVMTYNQWRENQDDGWVIMEVKDETEISTSIPRQEEN